jgi:hypothetical protein
MRNSLALLGIPDLPIYAFRHVGDRRIQPQGGVASVVESASDVISDVGQGLIETAPLRWSGGGGILGEIGGAITDTVGNVSDAMAEVDDTVNEEIPGGWATVINVATAGQAAPYVQAAQAGNVIAKGGSLEDAAKGYVISSIASEAGGAVGAETGSNFVGNVAGGTTAGLLSGKSLEESVKGGVTGGVISQATPSTLLSSTPSGTSGTQEYIPESNIGQSTPSSTSGFYTGQGTTGATNMAQEDFTYGYGGEGYQYDGVGSTPYPEYYRTSIAPDYGNPEDYGVNPDGMMPPDINYGSPEDYGVNPDGMPPPSAFSSFDAATQAYLRRLLAAGGSAAQGARNLLSSITGGMNSNLLQGGAGTAAQLMQLQANREAAQQAQARIGQATQQAVAGAQFRPVGTTTRFGTSNFQVDPATGQLVSAGYTAAPEITSAQNRLMSLGSSYLAQTPEEVAQQYMTRQYDLLDPSRQRQLAGIRNQNFQTGRGGLSVGSTGLRPSGAQGLMGSNPELEAYYNALAQQDAQLAAQAQQAGQQQVSFGTGLFGQAGQLETMAQQPFSLSQGLAEKSSLGGARAGSLGIQGNVYGNAIGLSAANTTNPFATVLGGLSSPTSLLSQGIGSYFSSPFGGTPQGGGAQLGQYMAGVMANPQSEQARMLAEQEAAFRY